MTREELRQLNELRQENNDLKARLKALELQNANFAKMTHSQLMRFFVENFAEYSYCEREMEKAGLSELYVEWQNAYSVFKGKRNERKALIGLYLKKYFATKQVGEMLVQSEVVLEIMEDVKKIYQQITPFDCEDEKWNGKYCTQSWKNRIHYFFSDYARENNLCFRYTNVATKR